MRRTILCLAGCVALFAQDYARDHVRFLIEQLAQWTRDFPQAFNAAILRPPIDASKLSETAKGGADAFAAHVQRLSALTDTRDLLTNAEFRAELQNTVASMKELNQAFGSQRFPNVLQSDWDQIRTLLNSVARVYQVETLAFVEPPGAGGRARPAVAGGIAGYIVDSSCAKKGKGMWVNAQCVASCIRDGDKVVLVTEEGKVYQITNPDKISPESYAQAVTVIGKTAGESITVESVR